VGGELPRIMLKPIGLVRNEVKEPPARGFGWQQVVSEIVIDSNLTDALDNLEEFSHIVVLCWMHRGKTGELPHKIHPRGDASLPLVGRLATRSPHRPNSIGQAVVRLQQRWGNVLTVKGLDATDGTPVIDIKPYIPGSDSVPDARVPPWLNQQ